MAETKEDANKAFDNTIERFEAKYAKAIGCFKKDRADMLAFLISPPNIGLILEQATR